MHTQTVLDFVIFQLTPTRTRCEIYAAAGDETEKLASGILKPFLSHMQAVKEQLSKGGHFIRLQPPLHPQHSSWFTKATLQRFIKFVSNPDVLERVSTIEMELMQLEETVRMQTRNASTVHVQGFCTNLSATPSPKGRKRRIPTNCQIVNQYGFSGKDGDSISGNSRKRLLHALDARRKVLRKEQGKFFARAAAAGFGSIHLTELILFSECFGATRLREACIQFTNLYKRRQETGLHIEGLATDAGIQSERSLSTQPKSQISYNSHCSDDGGSRVPEEGCKNLSTDLKDSFHGAGWACTPDDDNQICTCRFADAMEGHFFSNTERQKFAVKGTGISNEDFRIYGCSPQTPPMGHVAEGHSLAAEDFSERERTADIVTQLPSCSSGWCNHHTQICCCCNNPIKSLQADQRIWTPFCLASCKDTKSHWLPESKFSSSSQTVTGEPLHDLVSDGSKYFPYALPHTKFDIQASDPSEHKCLFSHDLIHSTTGKINFVHDYSSPRQHGMGIALRQSEHNHDHGSFSDMVVVNNQIFTASHLMNQSAKPIEMAGKCCKDQGCGKDMKHELSPDPSHLSVRDVVNIFERKCQDEPMLKDNCQMQESHIGDNFQKVRNNVLEKGTADGVLIWGEYYNDENQETRKVDEITYSSSGGEKSPNGMALYKLGPGEWTGLPCTLDTNNLKPPQKALKAPRNTTLFVECTTGNLSRKSVVRKENSSKMDLKQQKLSLEKDSAKTSHDSDAKLTNEHVSGPSEERVKKFLDRYHAKRQLKLKIRSTADKGETDLNLKTMQAVLDEKQARNHDTEQLIMFDETNLQANKPQIYKGSTPKSKKEKADEEQKRPEELKVCRRERISTGTSTLATTSYLQSPRSSKSAVPTKASVAGLSPKQKGDVRLLSGTSKRLRNPLTSSAPSLIKIQSKTVGTISLRASIGSQHSVDKKGRSPLHSKAKPLGTVSSTVDHKAHKVSKSSTRKVKPSAPDTKDQSRYLDKNGKGSSLPNSISTDAKEGPRNFLRKGAGARSRVGVLQPKVANSKEVATLHKGTHVMLSPPLKPQDDGMTIGQQSQVMPTECSIPKQEANARAETHSPTNASEIDSGSFGNCANGYERASQQESSGGLKGNVCANASPLHSTSRSSVVASFHEETSLSISANNLQPICGSHMTSEEENPDGSTQMQSCSTSKDTFLNATEFLTPCTPTEPLITMQSSVYTDTCDPFEIPPAQGREIPNPRFSEERVNHFVDSAISDVSSSKTEFQQLGMKWGTSRYISFIEPAPTSGQGKDSKKFLNFGRKSMHAARCDTTDQAFASIFSEEDEDRGSFSETGSKIMDCYGRKRHSSGKGLHHRASGNDLHQCSPSTSEHDESKSRKTIIPFKRSVSTHEVRSKSQDRELSKKSAAKATRAFFSLAPFRRKAVEGKC